MLAAVLRVTTDFCGASCERYEMQSDTGSKGARIMGNTIFLLWTRITSHEASKSQEVASRRGYFRMEYLIAKYVFTA
jgi:hypothetical protein